MDITHLRFRTAMRLQLIQATWRERLVCVARDHDWNDEPDIIITSGPLHVPPTERHYQVLAFVTQCRRCHLARDVTTVDPGAVQDAIAEARMDDLATWDDPDARAAHLELIDDAWEQAQEWRRNRER